MSCYHIQLYETRLTTDDRDDVALFDVIREDDDQTWRVPVFLSPLFRVLCMKFQAPEENRQEMVAGLGARAITERLKHGQEPPYDEGLIMAADYPGSPGDPHPLLPYDHITICTNEATSP